MDILETQPFEALFLNSPAAIVTTRGRFWQRSATLPGCLTWMPKWPVWNLRIWMVDISTYMTGWYIYLHDAYMNGWFLWDQLVGKYNIPVPCIRHGLVMYVIFQSKTVAFCATWIPHLGFGQRSHWTAGPGCSATRCRSQAESEGCNGEKLSFWGESWNHYVHIRLLSKGWNQLHLLVRSLLWTCWYSKEMLHTYTSQKSRSAVKNWPAYL